MQAGTERAFVNFERLGDTLQTNRKVRPFTSSIVDRQGNYLVPDFQAASVLRYSPDWVLLDKFPRDHSRGQGYEPVECLEAASRQQGKHLRNERGGRLPLRRQ